jgi:PadR family transcriptional regulator, regulatory protein PadR
MSRRPSPQTLRVLAALVADPATWRHGYALGREVGLPSGSLYPIMIRLHEHGLLESRWETPAPRGRPPRHEYRLTPDGTELALATARAERAGRTARQPRPRLA